MGKNRRYGYWMLLILAVMVGWGCGNKHIDNQAMEEEFENAPEWVLIGHETGVFSAVGSARIGKSGIQFAKTAALAQARNELARQLSVRVHSLVKNFALQTGMGNTQTADRMGKQVSNQVTQKTLNGSSQKDVWIAPSSDLYVLMVLDTEALKGSVKRQMLSSIKEKEARWHNFTIMGGEEELDKTIDSAF
ncbi:MAG: LPP20 family lipoprotein [Desulfobacter sp.]|nr:LPP20 family lipoprotein [Desulfobacter sp.]